MDDHDTYTNLNCQIDLNWQLLILYYSLKERAQSSHSSGNQTTLGAIFVFHSLKNVLESDNSGTAIGF